MIDSEFAALVEQLPVPEAKRAWRKRFRRERTGLTADFRAAAASALVGVVSGADLGCVAAYVPVGSEPGSLALLDALGSVLLPVTPSEPGPLDWARSGDLRPGEFGLLEPTGPRLGADALAGVDSVLLPALGVSRGGVRLGRGAGYYDRSLQVNGISGPVLLGRAAPGSAGSGSAVSGRSRPTLIAVVYDHELVEHLPSEPTDIPVHAALTPSGLVWLKNRHG